MKSICMSVCLALLVVALVVPALAEDGWNVTVKEFTFDGVKCGVVKSIRKGGPGAPDGLFKGFFGNTQVYQQIIMKNKNGEVVALGEGSSVNNRGLGTEMAAGATRDVAGGLFYVWGQQTRAVNKTVQNVTANTGRAVTNNSNTNSNALTNSNFLSQSQQQTQTGTNILIDPGNGGGPGGVNSGGNGGNGGDHPGNGFGDNNHGHTGCRW